MMTISVNTGSVVSNLTKQISLVKPKLAETICSDVTARTPVRTGRARAGWDITESAFKPAPPEGTYGYPAQKKAPKTPNDIYIYNPVDYIESLNEGSSKQAPPMFVEVAVWNAIFRHKV